MRTFTKTLVAAAALVGALTTIQSAHADTTNQMLPPTQISNAAGCDFSLSPWPQILFYNGSSDATLPKGAATINCFYGLAVQPGTGDLFLGSPAYYGSTWDNNTADYGLGLHFSGYSGENTDDIFFKRVNLSKDLSELRLVVGDNATSPYPYGDANGVGDAFVIGATDYVGGYKWYPRVTFTSNGRVGIGATVPLSVLHVVAPPENNNNTGILVESTSSTYGSPRIGFVDTALGANTDAPAWYVDNLQDRFRIFRQPNVFTAGLEALTITKDLNVGIGTASPQAKLDVNGGIKIGTDTTCTPEKAGTVSYNDGHPMICVEGGKMVSLSGGSFLVSFATLNTYHPNCPATWKNNVSSFSADTTAYCSSACNRFCQAQGMAGGTIVEWNGDNSLAQCTCTTGLVNNAKIY